MWARLCLASFCLCQAARRSVLHETAVAAVQEDTQEGDVEECTAFSLAARFGFGNPTCFFQVRLNFSGELNTSSLADAEVQLTYHSHEFLNGFDALTDLLNSGGDNDVVRTMVNDVVDGIEAALKADIDKKKEEFKTYAATALQNGELIEQEFGGTAAAAARHLLQNVDELVKELLPQASLTNTAQNPSQELKGHVEIPDAKQAVESTFCDNPLGGYSSFALRSLPWLLLGAVVGVRKNAWLGLAIGGIGTLLMSNIVLAPLCHCVSSFVLGSEKTEFTGSVPVLPEMADSGAPPELETTVKFDGESLTVDFQAMTLASLTKWVEGMATASAEAYSNSSSIPAEMEELHMKEVTYVKDKLSFGQTTFAILKVVMDVTCAPTCANCYIAACEAAASS